MSTVDSIEGLECVVGKSRLLVPAEFVEGVVEVEVSAPPPLARRWVGGFGYHGERPVLCVSLVTSKDSVQQSRRLVKGVLLSMDNTNVSWLLEVNAVKAFARVRRLQRRTTPSHESQLPAWVGVAADASGQTLRWLDVSSMVKQLAGNI